MKPCFTICIILGTLYTSAQNLVLNNDFELYDCIPWYISSIEDCKDWTNPTKSSPDYFNNSCIESKTAAIPQKYWGYQLPQSGQAYMGIIAFDYRKHHLPLAGAEYIQGKLTEPLKANETYIVNFYVSLAECSKIALEQLGVYFSDSSSHYKTAEVLTLKPQISSHVALKDTAQWISVTETFIAKGNEQYFMIGCFNTGKKVEFKKVKSATTIKDTRDYAYYYIDNVSVKLELKKDADSPKTAIDSLLQPSTR